MNRLLALLICAFIFPTAAFADNTYSIDVIDGIPYLVEYGTPQGGSFAKTDRRTIQLAGEWLFRIDPAETGLQEAWHANNVDQALWDAHPVPSVWQTRDANLRFYNGKAWYRRKFPVKDIGESAVFLKFEGVSLFAKVWFNETYLGEHEGGYTPFRFDVTKLIKPDGDNVIVVEVDNRVRKDTVPAKADFGVFSIFGGGGPTSPLIGGRTHVEELGWWPYGGIHGAVYLEFAPRVNIVKAVVEATPDGDGGKIKIEGVLWNRTRSPAPMKLKCEISDGDAAIVADFPCGDVAVPAGGYASFRTTQKVDGVKAWRPSNPKLYDLKISAKGDPYEETIHITIGFRSFAVDGGKLKLNGKDVFLFGISRHEDDPAVGLAQTPDVISNDLDMIQDLGANFIRASNYPAHPAFLDECDRRGIMVVEEIPLTRVAGNQFDDPAMRSRAKLQIAEMIERDINHPSVIMWSLGSDVWSFIKSAGEMVRDLKMTARRMDLVRPITMSLLVLPHITNRRDFVAPELDVLTVNEHFGWFYGDVEDAAKYVDYIHKTYPDKPIIVAEFGAQTALGFRDPTKKRTFSEEWQVDFMTKQLRSLAANPFVQGVAPASFSDYRCPWHSERLINPNMSIQGLVDQRRNPKPAFAAVLDYYKIMRQTRDGG